MVGGPVDDHRAVPRRVHPRPGQVESVGPSVEVLATLAGRPVSLVLLRELSWWQSFHPELTPDTRLQASFLALVAQR